MHVEYSRFLKDPLSDLCISNTYYKYKSGNNLKETNAQKGDRGDSQPRIQKVCSWQ